MKAKPTWSRLWPALCCGAVFAVLFIMQSIAGLYADDYHYAIFWRDGLKGFIDLNVDHYQTFNGRVAVHLVAETLLALPRWAAAAVNTAFLLLTGLLAMRVLGDSRDRRETVTGTALFGTGLLLMGRVVLRESLLWTAAYCNYFLPIILLLPACAAWDRWLRRGRWVQLLWLLPVQLLCGATTELCGAMAGAATGCLGLCWLWRDRPGLRRGWRFVLAPLANLLGYLTIFLSPATQNRTGAYATFTLEGILNALPAWARNLVRPDGITPVLLLFCLVAALYGWMQGGKLRLLLLGLPVAIALSVHLLNGGPEEAAVALITVVMIYLLLSALVLGLEGQGLAGALLASAVAGQIVMLPTNSFVPRTVVPFILPLVLVGASFLSRCLEALWPEGKLPGAVVCLGTAVTLCWFSPIVVGYWNNHLLDLENEAAAARARETGVLYYCIDYDARYGAVYRMFNDDYFRTTYLEMEQLSDATLYFTSETRPAILVNGERLQAPVWTDGDLVCLPIAQVVRALGGTAEWLPDVTRYNLNGIDVTLYLGAPSFVCQKGEETWEVWIAGEASTDFHTVCYSPRILRDTLGLVFEYDPAANVYYLSGTVDVPHSAAATS